MFLKTLTLRGFKSFADRTDLTLEPGVTVVVGPNGSGKSNIADALAWVLGSHSPSRLRGGAMSDVVFAGAPGRPALGRASVEITIDNADGVLPLEFAEVSIARSMFANGETTYTINGVACRLLDVQELLSDAGLGLVHHTILGQGQLDAVLDARPADRRAYIEEAAGILKHRRRRERALRKLTQVDDHVERLGDVVAELQRSLKPLQRQARAAAKHAELTAALRAAQRVQLLRELDRRTRSWATGERQVAQRQAQVAALREQVEACRAREAAARQQLTRRAGVAEQARRTHFDLAQAVERLRGLADRVADAGRGLRTDGDPPPERDPAALGAAADGEERRRFAAERALDAERTRARAAAEESQRAADAQRASARRAQAASEARAQDTQRRLRWEGQLAAAETGLAQAAAEDRRFEARAAELAEQARATQEALAGAVLRRDASCTAAAAAASRLAELDATLAARTGEHDTVVTAERAAERELAAARARAEALRATVRSPAEGLTAALKAADRGEVSGVIGPLLDVITVPGEMADAAAAALGRLSEALLVTDADCAASAVQLVSDRDAGWVLAVPAKGREANGAVTPAVVASGARPLSDEVTVTEPGAGAVARALHGVYLVDDFAAACRLAGRYPALTFVTPGGMLAGPDGFMTRDTRTGVAVRARAEAATAHARGAHERLEECRRARALAGERAAEIRDAVETARAAERQAQADRAGAEEETRRLEGVERGVSAALEALQAQRAELAAETQRQRGRLRSLRAAQPASAEPSPEATDPQARQRLDERLTRAREADMEARLAVAARLQEVNESDRRLQALRTEIDRAQRAQAAAQRRRARRDELLERHGRLERNTAAALDAATGATDRAERERQEAQLAEARQSEQAESLRREAQELDETLSECVAQLHADDLAQRDLRHGLDGVRDRLRGILNADPDEALRAADEATLAPDDDRDADLADEVGQLTRSVALLGPVNPLAVQQFAELGQRNEFLSAQLDDLRASRRDLLKVVEAVDARIREVFAEAVRDVGTHFERMFGLLFPGGEGRLVLTEPDDLLNSGVDIEARPPGKRVKRLSLLSGGERALTALAAMFAIFAARPSPFYVLDEVEAALDDVNLRRFLDVVQEFRADSQLIVISHHQPTMGIADSLYGVSMRPGGVSKVVSKRLTPAAT